MKEGTDAQNMTMLHGPCCFLGKTLGIWDSIPLYIQATASLWEDHEATKRVKFELKKQPLAALEDVLSTSSSLFLLNFLAIWLYLGAGNPPWT